jgi:hypothetical protein
VTLDDPANRPLTAHPNVRLFCYESIRETYTFFGGLVHADQASGFSYGVAFAKNTSRLNGCGGATSVNAMAAKSFVETMPL